MALLPFGQFSHANLEYDKITQSATAGVYFLQQHAAVRIVGDAGQPAWQTTIKLPLLDESPYGPSLYFISWNGHGTIIFERVTGSTDTINGGAGPVTYLGTDYTTATEFLVLALDGNYRIMVLRSGAAAGAVGVDAPNVQFSSPNVVDCGHGSGNGTLHFASSNTATAPTLGADAICLGTATGLSHGAESVVIGKVSSNASANAVAIGEHSGAVLASSQAIGESVGVAAGSAVVGKATGAVLGGAAVVGSCVAVGAGGCVLGHASGASVAAGEIVLGTGTPANVAGRLNILGAEAEVANTQANGDDYEFLALNLNGNLRYIPLTHTTKLNGQNDGLNLICMGEDACGGVSGRAKTQLAAGTDQSLVIGEEACGSWNATSTSTTGAIIVIGEDALKNTIAAGNYIQMTAIGTRCLAGSVQTAAAAGSTYIGHECKRDYQGGNDNVMIGHLNSQTCPSTASSSTKIGRGIQRLATSTGGSRQVLVGANIMESATCTFADNNYCVMIGYAICSTAGGQLSGDNVFIGRVLTTPTVGAANVTQNTIVGGATLTGTGASLGCRNAVCVGGGTLIGAGAGLGTDNVIVGGRTFTANVAPLNDNLTCLGAAQTGVPNTSEVMIGKSCAAAGVTGRLSFGNAMEAVAAAATAGAAALPANPAAFIPISWNGVNYKIPVYNP